MSTKQDDLAKLYLRAQQAETRAEVKDILKQAEALRNQARHIHDITVPSQQ